MFVGERCLEPPLHLADTNLNRKLLDVFTTLKFIFSTQRNSFSVIDFLISNLLSHEYSFLRQSEV